MLETKRHTEELEKIEAAKKQAAEEAEIQRQEELAAQREAERQAEEARQQEQAKAARQQEQAKTAESANRSASSANRSDAAQAQEPAADLPENDGYGYAERKNGMTIKLNGALNKAILIRKMLLKKKAKEPVLGLTPYQLHKHRYDEHRHNPYHNDRDTRHRCFNFPHFDSDRHAQRMTGSAESQSFRDRIFHFKQL